MSNNDDQFKKIANISSFNPQQLDKIIPQTNLGNMSGLLNQQRHLEESMKDLYKTRRIKEEKEEVYKHAVLEALREIQKNTANLAEIVLLIQDSNDKQEDIFQLLVEILSLSKLKDEKEIQTTYKKIWNKISSTFDDIETVQKLSGILFVIYNMAIKNADKVSTIVDTITKG